MPRIPGTRNGGVPPNIVWNADNPPMKNMCSEMVDIHRADCDGSCPVEPLTELECELINENREWARIGMHTGNVMRDVFRMSVQIKALINVVETLVPRTEINIEYQRTLLNELRHIREENQEHVKRVQLGLPPKGIVGPNGEIL